LIISGISTAKTARKRKKKRTNTTSPPKKPSLVFAAQTKDQTLTEVWGLYILPGKKKYCSLPAKAQTIQDLKRLVRGPLSEGKKEKRGRPIIYSQRRRGSGNLPQR